MPPGPLPPGKLRQIVTYLEVTPPPARPAASPPVAAESVGEPPARLSPEDYRALYRAVGERWLWWERLALADAAFGAAQ